MNSSLGIVDYVVLCLSMLVCVGIGYLSGRSGQGSLDRVSEFLLASRSMTMIPTAFSIMATLLSANAIAGAIGEMYVFGVTSAFSVVGGTITKVLAAFFIVPVFHAMEYTSIYEYMEKRFDRSVRTLFAALYVMCNMVYLGTVLYGPSVSLTTITGVPYWVTVTSVGLICTLYCVMGGLKAVIWTDVVQAIMMFLCVLLVTIQGAKTVGSLGEVYNVAFGEGVQQIIILEDTTVRYTVWGVIISSICTTIKSSVAGQAGAQRFLCVENHSVAAKMLASRRRSLAGKKNFRMGTFVAALSYTFIIRSLILSSVIMTVFKLFTILASLVIYTLYSQCDPLSQPGVTKIHQADQIYIYAVSRLLSGTPGLQGLALAGLLSASLSTCSSYINSFATITLQDFVKPYKPQWANKDSRNIILCKVFTFVYGVLAILMSFAVPAMGGLVKVSHGVSGSILGPLAGAMLVGLLSWRVNAKACKVGLIVGMVITVWMTLGSIIYPMNYQTLPHSTDACPTENGTLTNATHSFHLHSSSHDHDTEVNSIFKRYVFPLHIVSFIWYAPIGMTISYVSAIILSYFIGEYVRPDTKFLTSYAARRMLAHEKKMSRRSKDVELRSSNFP